MGDLLTINESFSVVFAGVAIAIACCVIWYCWCRLACKGATAHLLFFKSITVVAVFVALYLNAMFLGIVPANQLEREYIREVRRSELSNVAAVSASLKIADQSLYLSKSDYRAVGKAVHGF